MGEHVQHNMFGIHLIGENFQHNTFMKHLVLGLVSRHFLFFVHVVSFHGIATSKRYGKWIRSNSLLFDKKWTLVGVNKTRENNTTV